MKKKYLSLLALAAIAFTGSASAQTTIRITGSTAFRGSTLNAIRNILQPGFTYAYSGTSFTGASQAIFTGTTKATAGPPASAATPVVIKVSFSGSTGGIQNLVENLTTGASTLWLQNGVTQTTGGTASASGPYDPPVTADITMADSFQSSTDFDTPALVGTRVAVLPFQWVRNNGSPNTLRNMTPWLATNLLSGGTPLSFFTGNPADSISVYATGRDEESGTRLVTFADCLFGISSNCTQYQVVGSPVTNLIPWPFIDAARPEGHSGYSGGSNLVTALNTTGSATNVNNPGHLVAYAGINDAAAVNPGVVATATSAITSGAVTSVSITNGGTNYGAGTTITFSGGGGTGAAATPVIDASGTITGATITSGGSGYTSAPTIAFRGGATLTWNGVAYSPDAVRNGQYTFWSYQLLYHRSGYASAAIAAQLAKQIRDVDAASAGILLPTMNVERTVEGGDVTPL